MAIVVNREKVKEVFAAYTAAYDAASNPKVQLKIEHTYRVANLCELIARSEKMPQEDVELVWLCGMLHDVGRFEQLRRYNTFEDAKSVDHASLGADILFVTENRIRDYIEEQEEDALIEKAIRQHSLYRMEEGMDERTTRICHVLRDADKIDILRVNVDFPLEEVYNTTTELLRNSEVTPEVMECVYEHHAVRRDLKQTPVDNVVGHICLTYELVYKESKKQMLSQGYLATLLNFESYNENTRADFAAIATELVSWLEEEEQVPSIDTKHKQNTFTLAGSDKLLFLVGSMWGVISIVMLVRAIGRQGLDFEFRFGVGVLFLVIAAGCILWGILSRRFYLKVDDSYLYYQGFFGKGKGYPRDEIRARMNKKNRLSLYHNDKRICYVFYEQTAKVIEEFLRKQQFKVEHRK